MQSPTELFKSIEHTLMHITDDPTQYIPKPQFIITYNNIPIDFITYIKNGTPLPQGGIQVISTLIITDTENNSFHWDYGFLNANKINVDFLNANNINVDLLSIQNIPHTLMWRHIRTTNWNNNKTSPNINNLGGATIAALLNDDHTVICYSIAICHPYDNFSKKIGRDSATGRLNSYQHCKVPKVTTTWKQLIQQWQNLPISHSHDKRELLQLDKLV